MGERLLSERTAASEPVLRVPGNGDPVRLHHPVRGRLPPRTLLRIPQQHGGDQTGRIQVRHPAQTTLGAKGRGYWSVDIQYLHSFIIVMYLAFR